MKVLLAALLDSLVYLVHISFLFLKEKGCWFIMLSPLVHRVLGNAPSFAHCSVVLVLLWHIEVLFKLLVDPRVVLAPLDSEVINPIKFFLSCSCVVNCAVSRNSVLILIFKVRI